MTDRIRRPTEVSRQTVTQDWRVLLEPEGSDMQDSRLRRVQIIIPTSPNVLVYVNDLPLGDEGRMSPEKLGLDRQYKGAQMSPGRQIAFMLMAHQDLMAVALTGLGNVSLIVEYV